MPQMAPLWWFILFLYFTFLFILYIVNLYYIFSPLSDKQSQVETVLKHSMNWKW